MVEGYAYRASRGFSVAWLLSVYEVVRVACMSRSSFVSRDVNKPTTRQTSQANDFVNAGSHVTEKPLLSG